MLIPIALAITAVATAFLLLFIVAGVTDVNTITPFWGSRSTTLAFAAC